MAARNVRIVIAALAAAGAVGCTFSPITASRIEGAIAPTFANLVHVQMSWLGVPPLPASQSGVTARCRRLIDRQAGSGEWTCVLAWRGPDRRLLRDTFELVVGTDGCYTATASAESFGGPMLTAEDGRRVRNVLYAFEGCFDTT
jgi:hypothetical protein